MSKTFRPIPCVTILPCRIDTTDNLVDDCGSSVDGQLVVAKTPWTIDGVEIKNPDGQTVALCSAQPGWKDSAIDLIRAVNCHEELLATVRQLLEAFPRLGDHSEQSAWDAIAAGNQAIANATK